MMSGGAPQSGGMNPAMMQMMMMMMMNNKSGKEGNKKDKNKECYDDPFVLPVVGDTILNNPQITL